MFQNRVDPCGNIIATNARGLWLGNRGVIHNSQREIVRPFKHKAWIICQLQFKERKRIIMAPERWTELFFLDEATALAAGHRPCFECRKEDARRFKSYWLQGNGDYGFDAKTSINAIDNVLHQERIDPKKNKVIHQRKRGDIPDGVFILLDNSPCLVKDGMLHHWTPFGYDQRFNFPDTPSFKILTPASIVNAIHAGYDPQIKL